MTLNDCREIATNAGLSIVFRQEEVYAWDEVLLSSMYAPFFYTTASIEYQREYQLSHEGQWTDLSMIIEWDRKPAALLPLSLDYKDGRWELGCFGMPVLVPLFRNGLPQSSRKKISQSILTLLDSLAMNLSIQEWRSVEYFHERIGLSDWHAAAMAAGGTCHLEHDLYIDLGQDMNSIKRGFRKSYKSLVSSGLREWHVGILSANEPEVWEEFRELHFDVAGKRTRSNETWQKHYSDIQSGSGFLVYLRDSNGRMTGAGFFNHTRDEGMYAVAAYDRSLFDKPLGHVVQYVAIEHLKSLGISWYKLGPRYYPSSSPAPSAKEISISEFKQGFASHLLPAFFITHPVTSS